MKFLGHTSSKVGYEATLSLLRSKGIPTYVRFSGVPSVWPTQYRTAIFVCLDRHYDDALRLLKDPSHQVREPVDVDEYERFSKDAPTSPLILRWSLVVLGVSVLFFVGAMFLYWRA
jgi:hypothetical protein